MALFAATDDLEARLGIDFTAEEDIRAEMLLTLASGLIQDAAGQQIALVTDDELTMPGTNADRITLPQRPVVSVTSITLDGSELAEGTDWYLKDNTIYRISSSLSDSDSICGGFGSPTQTLVITYTHGYATTDIPGLVTSICLEAAVRVWTNPGAVIAERIGDEDVTYAPYSDPPRGLLLTDAEERKLRRFFGQRAMTVSVG